MGGSWHEVISTVIARSQLCEPDELTSILSQAVAPVGLDATLYLVDLQQRHLHPCPEKATPEGAPLPVEGSVAGRAFSSVRTMRSKGTGDTGQLWVPLTDGTARLGVLGFRLRPGIDADDPDVRHGCELLGGLVGHLVACSLPYGDLLHRVRRTRPVSVAAELVLALVPPQTFSCDRMTITAHLEPCYTHGGDAFDYAIDGPWCRFAILDAMGHGLNAGLTAATTIAAMRSARRDGHGLYSMARAADESIVDQFRDARFATAVLGELQLDTGLLRYVNAGHPAGIVLRHGKAVRFLAGGRRLPLGHDDPYIEVAEEQLESGDALLLYTDGITEAHPPGGERFGEERLIDLAERHSVENLAPAEKLRRLAHQVRVHQRDEPRDDATLMLIEWSTAASLQGSSITANRRGLA